MSLVFPSSMLEERSFDADAGTGLCLDLLCRRLHQMINAIMAIKMPAAAAETPAIRAFETLCLGEVVDLNGGLVNAIGGPPAHSQYPTLFWYAFPADGEYLYFHMTFPDGKENSPLRQ
jgi:hypothetical protein